MTVPDWWAAVLLGLAAWRSWQLLAHDDILERPRRRLLRLGDWEEGNLVYPPDYRIRLGEFIRCPYCAGFWVAVVWFAAYEVTQHWTLVVATPFALSVGVIALARTYSE